MTIVRLLAAISTGLLIFWTSGKCGKAESHVIPRFVCL